MPERRDHAGLRYGLLTAVRDVGNDDHGRLWECKCDCGNVIVIGTNHFASQISCGCVQHGMTGHRAHGIWRSMKSRCADKNSKNYGGRGISVCEEWKWFENFWRDMGPTYRHDLTLERIDVNKGYCKENCRWATQQEQMLNTRVNRRINTPWGFITVTEAARISGVPFRRIFKRIALGWPESRLFDPPTSNNPTGITGRFP